MGLYQKRPVIIEAVQLTWENWSEICDFVGIGTLEDGKPTGTWVDEDGNATEDPQVHRDTDTLGLLIPTLEGLMLARENDWIIKGIQGEFYPCKPDIFELTYAPLEKKIRTNLDTEFLHDGFYHDS
jgi:hypothetical protein